MPSKNAEFINCLWSSFLILTPVSLGISQLAHRPGNEIKNAFIRRLGLPLSHLTSKPGYPDCVCAETLTYARNS